MTRKFTVIDEGFVCAVCGVCVEPLGYSARNHCRECLCSLHLDVYPGDRRSDCGGVLRPVGVELNKKGQQIVHECSKCKVIKKNIVADDDNYELILELSARKVYEV